MKIRLDQNFETDYFYDPLGNLLQVDQGTQHRYFTYDSLSRLKTGKNPEQVNSSGTQITTQYDYDDGSNLLTRTNANGTTVTFTYDGLNRVKTKTLSTGGQWDYTYDTAAISNAKGRLVSVVLHGVTDGYYYDGYDVMGRVTSSRQITTAATPNSYSMSYQYDLAGNMTRETYPSGKVVVTEYDDAGRIAGVKKDGGNYYAGDRPGNATTRVQYAAHGAMSAVKLGNGKWERTLFNGRLQPMEIDLGATNGASDLLKLEYTYNTTAQANNNGNVLTQKITAPNTVGGSLVLTQNYTYDPLNRLSVAEEFNGTTSQWKQTYDMDRFGNRAVRIGSYTPNSTLTPQSANSTDFSAFNQSTNRIALGGFDYDTSGNLKSDPTTGANSMVYDAENRQTSYTKSGVTTSYSYDGDGHRVKKIDNNGTTVFVYNAGGQLIAEYTSGPPQGSGTSYLTSDHLGSTRVVTKQDGTVKARYDYLPFGEELPSSAGSRSSVAGYGAADSTRQKFTQKERDSESGLDYFLARYYSSAQGRFTSPDEFTGGPDDLFDFAEDAADNPTVYADIYNPQSLNKYQYCLNNPARFVDPDGHQDLTAEALKLGVKVGTRAAVPGLGWVVLGFEAAVGLFKAIDDGNPTGDGSCRSCDVNLQRYQEQKQAELGANTHQTKGDGEKVTDPVSGKEVTPRKAQNLAEADRKGTPRDQLGPSGKPKVNTVKHPTEKSAKDAAQARSKGPVQKDTRPLKGGPHYHETKPSGERKKGKQNVHHEYPRKRGQAS